MDEGRSPYESLFENIRRDVDPKQLKRGLRFVTIVGLLILLAVVGFACLVPATEYLWYLHDARHPEVFSLGYRTRGALFAITFVIGWVVLYLNLKLALNVTMVFLQTPSSKGVMLVTNAITFAQSRGTAIVRWGAPILAFFSALDFSNEWSTWLLARHAHAFNMKDPVYGMDLSFYVFTLPWYRAVWNFTWALLLLTTLATVGIYAALQGMAALAKIELGGPKVRSHIHALVGLAIAAYGVQTFLGTYEAGLVESAQFTGAGFAAMQGIMAQRLVAFLALGVGAATIANGWVWRPYLVPSWGAGGLAAIYAIGVLVVPGILQKFHVAPDQLNVEAPFATRAITMTRFAYGLDKIQIRDEVPTLAPTPAEVSASQSTLDNMRLWDPTVLQTCLEGLQGIRPYYRFYDVDVDRYRIAGKQTLLMLSPRQIDLNGLQQNAQNWTNQRLLFTHGYGVVVARVDQATADGKPVMLDRDIPEQSTPDLAVTEPRIYFGDQRDESGRTSDEYAIVDTGQAEFDYPTTDSQAKYRWTGTGGIPIGGLLSRLMFSVVLGDGNLLVTPEVKSASRLLMHRNVLERASRVYPFLKFESDPYIVILNGRIVWVLDGYTTSDTMPYSSMAEVTLYRTGGFSNERLNYIRNSVKIAVDAYSGEMTAYAVDPTEPVLAAWRDVYPGLVKDASAIPPGLAEHFRFPEGLIDAQSNELCTYHVTDPKTFLGNSDAWVIASQRGLQGEKERIRPFYVELELPDEPSAEFALILPFTPNARINMSGWLAARCDPEHYGQETLYRLNQATPVAGPEQMEGTFNTTPEISNINKQFQNQQSSIIVGNLIVVPIGKSFLYAESLFLKSNTQNLQAVPQLTKVILALNSRVVLADTYKEALQDLLGTTNYSPGPIGTATRSPGTAQQPATTPTGPISAGDYKAIQGTLDLFDQADAALRKGDFAKFGELQKQAKERLKTLLSAKKP